CSTPKHAEAHRMAPRQLRVDRANCNQLLRISTLLGHWAAELPISQQRSNQFASNELVSDLIFWLSGATQDRASSIREGGGGPRFPYQRQGERLPGCARPLALKCGAPSNGKALQENFKGRR